MDGRNHISQYFYIMHFHHLWLSLCLQIDVYTKMKEKLNRKYLSHWPITTKPQPQALVSKKITPLFLYITQGSYVYRKIISTGLQRFGFGTYIAFIYKSMYNTPISAVYQQRHSPFERCQTYHHLNLTTKWK